MSNQLELPFGAAGHHVHAAHANAAPNGKLKRGCQCFCGLVFWALSNSKKEVWLSLGDFLERKKKHNSSAAKYRAKHSYRISKWHRDNRRKDPNKARQESREHYRKNALRIRLAKAKKRAENPQKHKEIYRAWYLKNRSRINERNKKWAIARRRESPIFRIRCILGARLSKILRGVKYASTIDLLGCTIEHLRAHLEAQFKPGMTWDNYGYRGWHIDHIRPLASFDLADPAQQRLACHFLNLQPLWASENLSKGARMDASAFSRGGVIDYELK